MEVFELFGWVCYSAGGESPFVKHKVGKWMFFFKDKEFAAGICYKAIEEGVVHECKHSYADDGVACFYLNGDDMAAHKRVIQFFLDNDLIRKTKKGKLYNIAFKYDDQTLAGEYGDDFKAEIKLEQFLDLETGEWKEGI